MARHSGGRQFTVGKTQRNTASCLPGIPWGGCLGEELQVIWELEAGAQVIQKAGLPNITDIAPNHRLDAFLYAVRWGAPRPMRTGTTSSRHSVAASPLRTISLTRLSVRWTWRV